MKYILLLIINVPVQSLQNNTTPRLLGSCMCWIVFLKLVVEVKIDNSLAGAFGLCRGVDCGVGGAFQVNRCRL